MRLRAGRIVEGYLAGLHRSPYRGFSIEFAEHRKYVPGDDVRYLDWKVLARTDRLYLKQFEDESNLICRILVDASESMAYRGPSAAFSKFEYAQCLAAALGWLILKQQDAVGLVTIGTEVHEHLELSSSASHLARLLEALDACVPHGETRIGRLMEQLAGRFDRRGLVFVISDMFDDFPVLMRGLQRLRLERHDVVALQVLDRAEVEFPFDRPMVFEGLEAGPDVAANPATIRSAYRREIRKFRESLTRSCRQQQIDFHTVLTDQAPDQVLATVLAGHGG